jgi:hypothetical protein
MSQNPNALSHDHALETRDIGGDRHEALCPVCNTWRPAFCITKLDAAGAWFFGTEWACDAEISHWQRLAAQETENG